MNDLVASAVPARFEPGSRVACYVLQEEIGRGGMAVVWRARDERNDRVVALKILAPDIASDQTFRQRFMRESKLVSNLEHAHIITVHEAGEDGGVLFIAMRLIRGGDVWSLIRQGPLSPDRVAEMVWQVAEALDFAHQKIFDQQRGLVHRDVKPGNMLLSEPTGHGRRDHVYLSDFGIAKSAPDLTHLTPTGLIVGTPDYIAPEQLSGKEVDGRADQYALACTAFELLCGEPPFRRYGDQRAVAYAHLHHRPPPVTARRTDLADEVDEVFARALAKTPASRYDTCRDFAAKLQWALELPPRGMEPSTNPVEPLTEPDFPPPEGGITNHPPRRIRWIMAAGAAALAIVLAAVGIVLWGGSTPPATKVSITSPASTLHCRPSTPQCPFTVAGHSTHVASGAHILVLVFPLQPAGAGWYVQSQSATIQANGGWSQSPSYIGAGKYPVHNGDTLQIEAIVVRAGASYQGRDLAVLAATASPISDPGQIRGVLGRSGIVMVSVKQPAGPPPSPSAVTSLMSKEATDAETHNTAAALSLYASTAFVKDAACLTHGSSTTWRGLKAIKARYKGLPAFSALQHKFPQVQFMPPDSLARTARATAQTVGILAPSATSPLPQYVRGNELWTFALINGKWLITSFTYNVCYSP